MPWVTPIWRFLIRGLIIFCFLFIKGILACLFNKGENCFAAGRIFVEDCILTNTFYTEEHNPDWHYHQNLQISFVYEGGKASTKKRTTYVEKGGSTFFYHAGEVHKWVSPKPLSKSLNLEIGNKTIAFDRGANC